MTDQLQLKMLLQELNCRTPVDAITPEASPAIVEFLQHEKQHRAQYRIQRLLASCGIQKHQIRTFEQYDWEFNPKIPKQDILAFRNSPWVDNAANLTLIGDPGIGKSHIAKALCFDAISNGHATYFTSAFDLLAKIKNARFPENKIEHFGRKVTVLCIDELGYTFHQKEDADLLFQIFSKRSEVLPTIVTSNLRPKQWGSIFSGPAASAILDRLSFNGKFLVWEAKVSYRAHAKQ